MSRQSRALVDCLLAACFCLGLVLGTIFYGVWAFLTDSDKRK